ncbi:serine aminopeptidase domain-containing protein [Pedobacter miscanthi]|jgi:pimeloyl-ACP methyl ester carboxylesterase|uniref:serine aminopeptidase domain-containing protein n=1 Tax=Pedobacter miscanthi TaxID=2259170 RepID=UPI0029313119|nr:alpha/beta hydrolase [Pedobacter miscanthi]
MKKYLLIPLFILISFFAVGQQKTSITIEQVTGAFNQNLKDSLYNMMSPQMKSALGKDGSDNLFGQLMNQLGKITDTKNISTAGAEMQRYNLTFERPLVDILLVIKDGQIAGIRQLPRPTPAPGSARKASPDNYTLGEPPAMLFGTLLLPAKTSEKVPIVLMIGGSGPTDRNMNQGDALVTNSFAMLADTLAANGIASLRYDKRGVAKSAQALGNNQIVVDNYVDDASAFVDQLKKDERFSKVIVLGHSEGSSIAITSALKSHPVGLICLSGYDTDLGTVLEGQLSKTLETADLKLAKTIISNLKKGNLYHGELSPAIQNLFSLTTQAYLISAMRHHAAVEIKKINAPILVISGGTDLQIGTDSGQRLAKANSKASFFAIQGMNHVLKNAPLDREENLKTYTNGELPINAVLGKVIVSFIKNLK